MEVFKSMTDSTVCATAMCFSQSRYTGKERDTESGNDYFGARYYASSMGRWMSPDWSAKEDPVPYAKLDNPQTLNLYAYVGNNPMGSIDPDGHSILGGSIGQCEANAAGNGCSTGASDQYQLFASQNQTQKQSAPHPYVAPTGPGTEIGNILDPVHPSNPGPIGNPSECVKACRHFAEGLPDHTQWTQGVPVVITVNGKLTINPAVKQGTAIATFVNGHYPGDEDPHKNSGIFLGPGLFGSAGSIQILDQWPGSPGPRPRDMSPNGGFGPGDRSNHSTAYYVIMAP